MRTPNVLALIVAILLAGTAGGQNQDDPPEDRSEPRESGVVERTERRLIQLDVSVRGPEQTVAALLAEDFEVTIDGKAIEDFYLDRACSELEPTQLQAGRPDTGDAPAPAPLSARPPRYLFYFDQAHLTMAGRGRSLALSRQIVPKIVVGGAEAMIVSAGRDVKRFSAWTSDQAALLQALDEVENDKLQWDTFAMQEDSRIEEIADLLGFSVEQQNTENRSSVSRDGAGGRSPIGGGGGGFESFASKSADETTAQMSQDSETLGAALNEGSVEIARSAARRFQKEEFWHTQKALTRFSMALSWLAELPPPKAAIYFADTMRANAGDHYLAIFGGVEASGGDRETVKTNLQTLGEHVQSYDKVIEEAAAHGVRLYTVSAQGLVAPSPFAGTITGGSGIRYSAQTSSTVRYRDAEDGLVGFAAETGGQAFLKGVKGKKIADSILSDLECVFIVSFDAGDLPQDKGLPVLVLVDKPKVKVQSRTKLVVPSQSAMLTSRLMAAFSHTEQANTGPAGDAQTVLIPTGFEDGRYRALVQLTVPGSKSAGATWDLGLSLLSRGNVRQDTSRRVTVGAGGVPVVLEYEVSFKPGPYEVVAVAHDNARDRVLTAKSEDDWPDPDDAEVIVGPIAVIQPVNAVFVRGDETRKQGSLARAESQHVRTDLPTALIGLVCKKPGREGLRIERKIAGDSSAGFPPVAVDSGNERCAVFSDLIRAGTMTSGMFSYEVRVFDGDEQVAAGARAFAALDPAEEIPAEPATGAGS